MGKFTYHYNASALGLGGVLQDDRGVTTIVPSIASVALAPTGGEGFIEITNYDKDGVSFSNARSRVTGYDSAHSKFTTSSDVYITNLNLFGRVKAAILQTNISSTRDVLETGELATESDPDKVRFSMQTMIRGLTIDGVEVIPELDLVLCECPTFDQFTRRIDEAPDTYARQFGLGQAQLQTAMAALPVRGSFVKDLQHQPTEKFGPRQGFKLPVKNFGNVHFGELVVKPGRRRVNLLRIEFDSTLQVGVQRKGRAALSSRGGTTSTTSPLGGTMTLLSQDSNGAPSWP